MKEQLLAELKELTENVSDTYDDFVYGINCTMKKQDEEDIQSVIDFIKENPERTSSDIIEYLDELGIKDTSLAEREALLFCPVVPLIVALWGFFSANSQIDDYKLISE